MVSKVISKVKVIDPRILQQEPVYQVQQGSGSVTYQRYAPNSGSTSLLKYQIQPPTSAVITERVVKYEGPMVFKSVVNIQPKNNAGVDVGAPTTVAFKGKPFLLFGLNSTLTDHPFNQCVENTQLQINNVSVNNASGENFNILKWMMNDPKDGLQKGTPSRLEMYQNYSGSAVFPNSNIQGISQANQYEAQPNGAFEGIRFCDANGNELDGNGTYASGGQNYAYINGVPVTCDATGATTGAEPIRTAYDVYIKVTVVERAFISPFIFNETHDSQTGLYNIRSISINHTIKVPSGIIKVDKRSEIVTDNTTTLFLSTLNTTFNNNNPWTNFSLVMTYRNPSIYETPPKVNTVPYNEYQTYKTTRAVNLAAGGKTRITTDVIIPASIPNMILIAIKPTSYAVDESEWFIPPDNISIQYGNSASLLTNATKQDLYEMSYKNGVQMTRAMWYGLAQQNYLNYNDDIYTTSEGHGYVPLCGGFLALVPGVDFPLKEDHASGVGVNMNFTVTMEFKNRLNIVVPSVEVLTVFVNSGFIMSADGSSTIQLMPITTEEVVSLPVDMDAHLDGTMVGGSFWNKVGSFLKKNVWKPVKSLAQNKQVRNFAKDQLRNTGNQYAVAAADIADKVGLGVRTGGRRKGLESLYI